jgi:hypothetical protein
LGQAVALAPSTSFRSAAVELFDRALPAVGEFTSPRAWAFALDGIHAYLGCYGGDSTARRMRDSLTQRLFDQFQANASDDWIWPEDSLTYANACLPKALLLGGQSMQRDEFTDLGLKSLDWLLHLQTRSKKVLSLVGNQGWLVRGGEKARFDQQPIEAYCLLDACREAHSVTGDERWSAEAWNCFNWFLGKNDLGEPLYDAVRIAGADSNQDLPAPKGRVS